MNRPEKPRAEQRTGPVPVPPGKPVLSPKTVVQSPPKEEACPYCVGTGECPACEGEHRGKIPVDDSAGRNKLWRDCECVTSKAGAGVCQCCRGRKTVAARQARGFTGAYDPAADANAKTAFDGQLG